MLSLVLVQRFFFIVLHVISAIGLMIYTVNHSNKTQ